jgi:hypothetical protein
LFLTHLFRYFYPVLTTVQQSFLEARTALPPVATFSGTMIIISVGECKGGWSLFHVYAPDETLHFVFIKQFATNQWRCADAGLQRWLDEHNTAALQLLEHI